MPPGIDKLQHIVVLMMENRSFDHMLGSLKADDPRIDGLTGNEANPDINGNQVPVQPLAEFQSQLDPDPDHHFAGVDLQIYGENQAPNRVPTMSGFVKSYYEEQRDVDHSHKIMYYFPKQKLPVITKLATEYAVFNRWFSSIPGPTICNRAFAHYGTSFGQVGMDIFYLGKPYFSIYERLIKANPPRTAKIYYFDQASSTIEIVNLLQHEPQLFATFDQFKADCKSGNLPQYCFVEPNYSDHEGKAGEVPASDQHPDHDVQEGELFIANVYNNIRKNQKLWESTLLLIVYDEHGGIYDHVPPPACLPDGFTATSADNKPITPFKFDRLGVRVPAVLVSPWIPRGTVIDGRVFEHASIPATVTKFFLGKYDERSPREKAADTFLDLLTLPSARTDSFFFHAS